MNGVIGDIHMSNNEFYLNSGNVKVFPAAKERLVIDDDVAMSRLLTEFNLANIVRQMIGSSKGFVIEVSRDDEYRNIINAKFNLFGYYFDIKYEASGEISGVVDVYASLEFDAFGTELNQDNNGVYTGLKLTEVSADASFEPTAENTLRLFSYKYTKNSGNVVVDAESLSVPPQSRFIFDSTALPIGGIDGKPKQ